MSIDATNQLIDEVNRLFERYAMEADLSYAELLGVIDIIKHNILHEARKHYNKSEEEGN